MRTSVSRRLNISCIMFKIIAFFMITMFSVRVSILLTSRKLLFDCVISLRGNVWANKTSLTCPFLLKYLFQPQKVRGDVYVCVRVIEFASSNDFAVGFCICSGSIFYYITHFMCIHIFGRNSQYNGLIISPIVTNWIYTLSYICR